MKNMLRVTLAILLCLCLSFPSIPAAQAGTTDYLPASVGSRYTLRASSRYGSVYSYGWYSNNINAVRIVGSVTSSTCTIEVVGYSSSDVIVRCDMYYIGSNGMIGSDYYDCVVRINNDGSGTTGSYTISGPSNVTVDLADTSPIKITSGVTFSDNVYLDYTNTQGNAGYYIEYSGKIAYLYIHPESLRNGACKIELIERRSSTYLIIKDSITIRYSTICSHRYNTGTVTVEPTYTSTGTKVRTCRYCGATKTETIPMLTPPAEYTITYHANGGENAPANQKKTPGTALQLSASLPTRQDKALESYTVTLDANGGSVSPKTLSAARTESFTFREWNTAANGSGTSYAPGASYTAEADATLYAQWDSSTKTAAVTLPIPTREGYAFKGWAASGSAASGVTGSYTPAGNVMLYAVWEEAGIFGAWGDLSWGLSDSGVLTISGSGKMNDFEAQSSFAWRPYAEDIRMVRIEKGVTSIGAFAFRDCNHMTDVTIPSSVTTLGSAAFYDCAGLEEIILPYGVEKIEDWVFRGCEKLESITIPGSVKAIGEQAFCLCTALQSVTIPDSVISVGDYLFNGCSGLISAKLPARVTHLGDGIFNECGSLREATIPEGISSLGESFFYNCAALEEVTIPAGVTAIGSWTLRGCESLTEVTIPDSVAAIGDHAFCVCTGLQYVTLPKALTSVEDLLFYGCSSLEEVTIPGNVTRIASSAFSNCSNLKKVTMAYGLVTIGDYAFGSCASLKEVTIPGSVAVIDDCAFYACSKLESVTLPLSLTTIGIGAFYECNALQNVYYAGLEEEWQAINIDYYNQWLTDAQIHFPAVMTLPAFLTEIEKEAFAGLPVQCVVIPETVTFIGSRAFANCPNLKRIIFKNGNAMVAEDFISGCRYAISIEAPAGSRVAENRELYEQNR